MILTSSFSSTVIFAVMILPSSFRWWRSLQLWSYHRSFIDGDLCSCNLTIVLSSNAIFAVVILPSSFFDGNIYSYDLTIILSLMVICTVWCYHHPFANENLCKLWSYYRPFVNGDLWSCDLTTILFAKNYVALNSSSHLGICKRKTCNLVKHPNKKPFCDLFYFPLQQFHHRRKKIAYANIIFANLTKWFP